MGRALIFGSKRKPTRREDGDSSSEDGTVFVPFSSAAWCQTSPTEPGGDRVRAVTTIRRPCTLTGYGPNQGNSLAAPVVTGTVGLMVAADPSLNGEPSLIKQRILCNATTNPAFETLVRDGNTLNAFAAVTNENSCP